MRGEFGETLYQRQLVPQSSFVSSLSQVTEDRERISLHTQEDTLYGKRSKSLQLHVDQASHQTRFLKSDRTMGQ